ncbi:mitochondrial carrier domain-containing protein [Glomus cerebriforme]|uniref:Mitochondrial carrier domain-containing protein n=1 Tax=Glomus cerebriforme TaxID=658196 RepID=A0A397SSK8_9GLOM|nr:mitochondrial carrier domain-containing protein [Glomus cerebriforme]
MPPSKDYNRTSQSSQNKTNSLSSAPPLKTLPPQPNISQLENFALSALAPSMAVVFTLPFDTVKVRMQLQGEVKIMKDITGKTIRVTAEKVYKSSLDCLWKTFKYEGIRGLEKGLNPSILKESSKNVFRLGLYDPILSVIHPKDDSTSSSSAPAWKRMLSGGICGALGAVSANPFELVKTRLQSSAAGAIAVGNQYRYNSVLSALRHIMSKEGGVMGLYRGSMISVYRGILGSAANLSCYTMLRDYALREGYPEGVPLDMGCSLLSAFASVVFMNPLDVVRTRLYNTSSSIKDRQPIFYTIKTIVKNEGWRSLYKGFGTHFMRIGPHFCLTFVFLEQLKRGVKQIKLEEYQRKLQQPHYS